MKSKSLILGLRALAAAFLLLAAIVGFVTYKQFAAETGPLPSGSQVGDIPVAGLTVQQAVERVTAIYTAPIELHYRGAIIQVSPSELGFRPDAEALKNQLAQQSARQGSLQQFWCYLWNQSQTTPVLITPAFMQSPEGIKQYLLTQIAPRYDQPATAAIPEAGGVGFKPGQAGYRMDVAASVSSIVAALQSTSQRQTTLTVSDEAAPPPEWQNLKIQLQQNIDLLDRETLIELVLIDPQTGQQLHFARQNGQDIPTDIAFTAASTIKIPIMISTFRRSEEPGNPDVSLKLEQMISVSENDPADWLMQNIMGGNLGPLEVTADMRKLGLENTFLAGYFYMGAPLLQKIETPANLRSDINLQPDLYNQTTPAEMAFLMHAIYQCAESGSGPLAATFAAEITPAECQRMVELLVSDRLPYLITAGLPDGTRVAHKHGWIEEADGLLHTMSDTAIVYAPARPYILTIYTHHPINLVFDNGNRLLARLSQVVYGFLNPPNP